MNKRTYVACRASVSEQHDKPPIAFLDTLIDVMNSLPDEVFQKNNRQDIYSVMLEPLGPYKSLLHRKAVMCEVLRVQAGFESDWNWNQGVDTTNSNSLLHREAEETGAFQVSWDSMQFDDSLQACLDRHEHAHDVLTFIDKMKTNHALAVEYCARLLRFNTRWCGTINDPSKVIAHVQRDAVAEFQTFLHLDSADGDTPGIETPVVDTKGGDKSHIKRLLDIASDATRLVNAQHRAAEALLAYNGAVYPQDGCAITLCILLQDAGINVPAIYQALALGTYLRDTRGWKVIPLGQQQPGDVGSTCGTRANHGFDHIYLVLKKLNDDEMLVADNQSSKPHFRFASGQGRTRTRFFLRPT